jgi:hypothetical protein
MGDLPTAEISVAPRANHRLRKVVLAVSLPFVLLNSCEGPTQNPRELRAIRVEAERLMATPPTGMDEWGHVPKSEWPPVIASLRPHEVTVNEQSVHISTKPFFDGGWGYEVARSRQDLGMPSECYSEVSPGVYWHNPC